MAFLSKSGQAGMTFSGIARLVELPFDELVALLDALVRGGEVGATRGKDGLLVYRRLI